MGFARGYAWEGVEEFEGASLKKSDALFKDWFLGLRLRVGC